MRRRWGWGWGNCEKLVAMCFSPEKVIVKGLNDTVAPHTLIKVKHIYYFNNIIYTHFKYMNEYILVCIIT